MSGHKGVGRRAFLSLCAGLGTLAAAGCRGNVAQPGSGPVPKGAEGKVRIVCWSAFAEATGKVLQDLADSFNTSQDEIFVEIQYQGSYDETAQKLATTLQARQVPDIVNFSDLTWYRFYFSNHLEPLSGYFDSSFAPSVYVDEFIEEGRAQGEIWWLSFARSTPIFVYNKDMFSQAGLPDRGPETWSELREWGPALQGLEATPVVHTYHTAPFNAWYFQGTAWQWGGALSDGWEVVIDEPPVVEAGEWIRRFIHQDKMAVAKQDPGAEFINGLTATAMSSTGALGGFSEAAKFEVGAAMLPAEKEFGCPTGGSGFSVLAAAPDERKQAAFEFLKFLAQPDQAVEWARRTGYLPVTKEAAQSEAMRKHFAENPAFEVAVKQIEKARIPDPARLVFPNSNATIGAGLDRIFTKNEPAQPALADVARQLEQDRDTLPDDAQDMLEK
ncbi:MAG TPA: ABC transporter substrate-binding protein [Actinopolymorphaceae bacterium]